MDKQDTIKTYLNKLGYTINDEAFRKIKIANDWFTNEKLPFHKRAERPGKTWANLTKITENLTKGGK